MVETPYENEIVFMHEGASGGGKSEMLEDFHRGTTTVCSSARTRSRAKNII